LFLGAKALPELAVGPNIAMPCAATRNGVGLKPKWLEEGGPDELALGDCGGVAARQESASVLAVTS
jgi:hypothetical protein